MLDSGCVRFADQSRVTEGSLPRVMPASRQAQTRSKTGSESMGRKSRSRALRAANELCVRSREELVEVAARIGDRAERLSHLELLCE